MLSKIIGSIKRIRGNDIFISYARADSINYSLAIANELSAQKYLCYLDQFHNIANKELPPEVISALNRSSAMIVIISPAALESEPIRQEIERFGKTGRLIVPVKIEHVSDILHISKLIPGLTLSVESAEAWQTAVPSKRIIERIKGSFTYRKRLRILRNTAIAVLSLIVAGICFGIYYSTVLRNNIKGLSLQKKELNDSVNSKNELLKIADANVMIMADSINGMNGNITLLNKSIVGMNDNIAVMTKSIAGMNDSLLSSKKLLKVLNDSAKSLYASNIIGYIKNEELNNERPGTASFNPFNLNKRMLLALESYKMNGNPNAEQILKDGLNFIGKKIMDKCLDDKIMDLAISQDTYQSYLGVLLENKDVYLIENQNSFKQKKIAHIESAVRLIFHPTEKLLIVQSWGGTWPNSYPVINVIDYNGNTQTSFDLTMMATCKKIEFTGNGDRLILMSYEGKIYCYNWKSKKVAFLCEGVDNFCVNRTDTTYSLDNYNLITDKISIWKVDRKSYKYDSICTYEFKDTIGRLLAPPVKLSINLFSDMSYSKSGNFFAIGDLFGGMSDGSGMHKLYYERQFLNGFAEEKSLAFSFPTWIGNGGFGLIDNSIYFSSIAEGKNTIHFFEFFGFQSRIKETFRIFYMQQLRKLVYSPNTRFLYGTDLEGKLLCWDVSLALSFSKEKNIELEKLKDKQLIDEVCSRLYANMTEAEWKLYLGDLPYCRTCSNLK
jgi:hypothetical protein